MKWDLLSDERKFMQMLYKNTVRTSQETYYVSTTKINCCLRKENHTEHKFCGQNVEFAYVKPGGTCNN
jgi:uncharacterized protein YehS (DUF1456 family)